MPFTSSRSLGIEIERFVAIRRPVERELRFEGDVFRLAGFEIGDVNAAVAGVEKAVAGQPRCGEWKYVVPVADGLARDHQKALIGRELFVGDTVSVGCARGRIHAGARGGGHQGALLAAVGYRANGGAVDSDAANECDLLPIGGPGGLVLIGGRGGPASDLAGGDLDHPDVVAAFEGAVGGERDAGSIGRDARLTIVAMPGGNLLQTRAIGVNRPDVKRSALVGFEGDQPAFGRIVGARRFEQGVGDLFRGAAAKGQHPQRTLKVHDQAALIGRGGDGDVRALPHRNLLAKGGGRRHGQSNRRQNPFHSGPLIMELATLREPCGAPENPARRAPAGKAPLLSDNPETLFRYMRTLRALRSRWDGLPGFRAPGRGRHPSCRTSRPDAREQSVRPSSRPGRGMRREHRARDRTGRAADHWLPMKARRCAGERLALNDTSVAFASTVAGGGYVEIGASRIGAGSRFQFVRARRECGQVRRSRWNPRRLWNARRVRKPWRTIHVTLPGWGTETKTTRPEGLRAICLPANSNGVRRPEASGPASARMISPMPGFSGMSKA